MRASSTLGVLVAVAFGAAAAQAQPIRARPSPAEVTAAWPPAAQDSAQGVAVMRCTVGADGAAAGCVVVKESPEGQGFGEALLALQSKFRLDPVRAGQPVVLGQSWPAPDTWPDWPRNPAAIFGSFLQRTSGRGAATLACVVETSGAFSNCVVAAETQPGGALGRDALSLLSRMKARPATRDGQPVRSLMIIPLRAIDR